MSGDIYNNKCIYSQDFWKICSILGFVTLPYDPYWGITAPLGITNFYQKVNQTIINKINNKKYSDIIFLVRTNRFPPSYNNNKYANLIRAKWKNYMNWKRSQVLSDRLPDDILELLYKYLD